MAVDQYPGLGELIDIFRVREYFDGLTEIRDLARRMREDAGFVGALRRALVRLPMDRKPALPAVPPWPARNPRAPVRTIRLGIVASGGSGALACLVGVLKACEEVGVRPRAMSFASGAALFGYPVAAGKSPDEVARFVLEAEPTAWVDANWHGLAGILPSQGRGFAGVIKGSRLEAAYSEFLGDTRLGDLKIPTYAPVWNIEHNRLEYIGPSTYPDLKVSRAIRMAVSLPLFVDPVPWRGGHWCDGGIVDIFPVHPILDLAPECDVVLGVNCFYPPGFAGEDASGWQERRWSMLDIADQVVTAQHVQLARENLRRLRAEVGTVMMIDPVPYELVRRAGFYVQFLDHSQWPEFMQAGRRAGLLALRRNLARGRRTKAS
ncbi:MAG TPA: patatin-like phospholipase family protein [Candidatus Dormibacteraeota bacterium]|nr:patatin-like phospholipase family protein [Candidatus Dormibacteraeota bacterium]